MRVGLSRTKARFNRSLWIQVEKVEEARKNDTSISETWSQCHRSFGGDTTTPKPIIRRTGPGTDAIDSRSCSGTLDQSLHAVDRYRTRLWRNPILFRNG